MLVGATGWRRQPVVGVAQAQHGHARGGQQVLGVRALAQVAQEALGIHGRVAVARGGHDNDRERRGVKVQGGKVIGGAAGQRQAAARALGHNLLRNTPRSARLRAKEHRDGRSHGHEGNTDGQTST
jgi:hypothetical protein